MSLDLNLIEKKHCPHCQGELEDGESLYWCNITHNLAEMADKAGIYKHLWRPEELGITTAKDLIEPLTKGLALLKRKPAYFKKFDSPNGWGQYVHFVPFVEKYLKACIANPEAGVHADR